MTGTTAGPAGPSPESIRRAVDGVAERMVALRRDIHAHPELAWKEVRTSALVADELPRAGLVPTALPVGTGLVCDVIGEPDGPVVVLRADLDALPIDDEKTVPYRSSVAGVAHACGHDVHTAVVLGAGISLARLAAAGALPGRVRLVFQPAEEVLPGGALAALEAGALDGVARVFAVHCDPRVEAGSVAVRAGSDHRGDRFGHGPTLGPRWSHGPPAAHRGPGGRPRRCGGPHAALLSRRVDPRAGLSLVWGRMAAGSASNVIPEHGEASGSVRALDPAAWEAAAELVPQLIREVGGAVPGPGRDRLRPWGPASGQRCGGHRGVPVGRRCPPRPRRRAQTPSRAWAPRTSPGSSTGCLACWCGWGCAGPGRSTHPTCIGGDFDVDESAIGCGVAN